MITERYDHTRNYFPRMGYGRGSGSSEAWFRDLYGATWKFIVHYDADGCRIHLSAVKIVDGKGVRSHSFAG